LKSGDFKAAWLSLLEPARKSPYSSLFDIIKGARDYRLGKGTAAQVGISCPDDKTLVVTLTTPASFFPKMLCHHCFSPIHPSMRSDAAWTPGHTVSDGPFYIKEFDAEHILFLKNENYWDAASVALNKLTLKFAKNGIEAAGLWNSGEARWIAGDVDISKLTDQSGILYTPMFATSYYFFRCDKKPWSDYRVRRALALALPWKEIRKPYALPAETLILPIPGYPKVKGMGEADPVEAAKLLTEADHAGGKGLPPLVIRIPSSDEDARIAGLMTKAWEALGLTVKTDVVDFDSYFDSLKKNDYEIGSTTWIGDFLDPYTFLQMWQKDSNLNDSDLDDPDYDSLITKSMGQKDDKERWKTLGDAEQLLLDRGIVFPIAYSPTLNIVDMDELSGWFPNALDIHPFKYLSFRKLKPLPGVA
jgi:peptide/nickel transport system substrate-binding protein/oligopeptide transport system substrate-binding protein